MPRILKVKRRISTGTNPGEKWLARIFHNETVGFEEIAEMISETSTLSAGDILNTLRQLETVVTWNLLQGNPVELGDLGKFYFKITAKAVDTLEEVTAETITRKYVRFRPSKRFYKKLRETKTTFVDLDIKGLPSKTGNETPTP
ncbi:hypothetical protein SDC9_15981 [bioreactor metagenome]|uniref:HU domain-containing protein n=1 Tax=bioreactor metagenome TaxID=1076179 RepID=A0A644TTA2_9ZZZZ